MPTDDTNPQPVITPAANPDANPVANISDFPSDIPEAGPEIGISTVIDDGKVREVEPGVFVRRPKGSKYIIEYRRDVCIGAVSCSAIAPLTFEMDDENKAKFVESEQSDEDDIILAAAQSCPVFAIIIKDAETGMQIFPPPEVD